MKEEKTIEERLRDMRISKDDPKALRKRIQELESKVQLLEHENISSASKLDIESSGDEIYNRLVNVYSNTQINKNIFDEDDSKAINKYKQGLEKELLSMDNINEEIIQRISDYINKKQIFNDFSPTDSAKAGAFLTKLIEISPLTEITLKLEKESGIDFFGYGFAEKKKIIVYGDLGHVGGDMKAGELKINGNVKSCGSHMKDGSIEITGYARAPGLFMKGGKIVVHGDTRNLCGSLMEGGVIEIYGNAHHYVADSMIGGKIHIKRDVIGDCGDFMKGGELEIDGNVNGEVGSFMEHGRIHIKGNVYGNVAKFMEGGTIHINGDQKPELHSVKLWSFGKYKITKKGGSVYHKNKLLG